MVREINGNHVVIAPDKGAACFGCMNMECKSSGGKISAENRTALPLAPGQTVEVEIPGLSLFTQVLMAFLPPFFGFLAGFSFFRFFFPASGEAAAALAGAILLFASAFAVIKLREKKPPKKTYTVTRIIM